MTRNNGRNASRKKKGQKRRRLPYYKDKGGRFIERPQAGRTQRLAYMENSVNS